MMCKILAHYQQYIIINTTINSEVLGFVNGIFAS